MFSSPRSLLQPLTTALLLGALIFHPDQAETGIGGRAAQALTPYESCIFTHVNPAVNNRAADYLRQACLRAYKPIKPGSNGRTPKGWAAMPHLEHPTRGYDLCLFRHMKNVRNDRAAQLTQQFCAQRNASEHLSEHLRTPNNRQNQIRAFLERNLLGRSPKSTPSNDTNLWMDGDRFNDLEPAQAGRSSPDAPFKRPF